MSKEVRIFRGALTSELRKSLIYIYIYILHSEIYRYKLFINTSDGLINFHYFTTWNLNVLYCGDFLTSKLCLPRQIKMKNNLDGVNWGRVPHSNSV